MELNQLRSRIDEIDAQLVSLFAQRMQVSAAIGNYKKAHNLPIYIPQREAEKLDALAALAGPEMTLYTRKLYETIFTLSRDFQGSNEVEK